MSRTWNRHSEKPSLAADAEKSSDAGRLAHSERNRGWGGHPIAPAEFPNLPSRHETQVSERPAPERTPSGPRPLESPFQFGSEINNS
jgi:hypothetical protein